jgi:hypothetical protein
LNPLRTAIAAGSTLSETFAVAFGTTGITTCLTVTVRPVASIETTSATTRGGVLVVVFWVELEDVDCVVVGGFSWAKARPAARTKAHESATRWFIAVAPAMRIQRLARGAIPRVG